MKNQPNKNHIFFRNLVVLSSIGIHDIEKEKPQRVIINAKLILDDPNTDLAIIKAEINITPINLI